MSSEMDLKIMCHIFFCECSAFTSPPLSLQLFFFLSASSPPSSSSQLRHSVDLCSFRNETGSCSSGLITRFFLFRGTWPKPTKKLQPFCSFGKTWHYFIQFSPRFFKNNFHVHFLSAFSPCYLREYLHAVIKSENLV